jgi:hypothetical protein
MNTKLLSRVLIALAVFAATTTVGSTSKASSDWFYADDFEPVPTKWTPWISPPGSGFLEQWPGAGIDGGSHVYIGGFAQGGTTSDFALVDQVFTIPSYAPGGTPDGCELALAVLPLGGVTGAIQLIDPSTWSYVASTSFTYPPSSTVWEYPVVGPYSGGCPRSVDARIVINNTTKGEGVEFDGAGMSWHFF